MTMTRDTKIYGLIGYPLGHSFSIDYFNNKFASEGVDAVYMNFEIEDVRQLMDLIAEYPQLCGLNVTAPYKEKVIPLLDELDDGARAIGAVNVIKFVRGASGNLLLRGYNSDALGFGRTVESLLTTDRDRALVLGTGGAAKAVKYALERLGVAVQLVSRHKNAHTIIYPELTRSTVAEHRIIVHATPLGKYPRVDECPDFPFRFLTDRHLVYDLIYNPEETLFMRRAHEQGAAVKNGLEMLLLQAFASYEIWNSPL